MSRLDTRLPHRRHLHRSTDSLPCHERTERQSCCGLYIFQKDFAYSTTGRTSVQRADLAQQGARLRHARPPPAVVLQARARQLAERGQLAVRHLPQARVQHLYGTGLGACMRLRHGRCAE
jgi:hypothetical protein